MAHSMNNLARGMTRKGMRIRFDPSRLDRVPSRYVSEDGTRYFENREVASAFRAVRYSDEILTSRGYRHTGYYCDDSYDRTLRGVVVYLSGRNHGCRLLWGYEELESGGFVLCDPREMVCADRDSDSALRDAAIEADEMAARMAEKGREYNQAWQSGMEYARLLQEMRDARRELLATLKDRCSVKSRRDRRLVGLDMHEYCRSRAIAIRYREENEPSSRDLRDTWREGLGCS